MFIIDQHLRRWGQGKAGLGRGEVQIPCWAVKPVESSEANLDPAFIFSSQSVAACSLPRRVQLPWSRRFSAAEAPLKALTSGVLSPSLGLLGPCISVYHTRSLFPSIPLALREYLSIYLPERDEVNINKSFQTHVNWLHFYSMLVGLTFFLSLIMVLFDRI